MSFLLALVPVIGGAFAAGTIGATIVNTAVVAGLSAVSSSLFKKPASGGAVGGVETTLSVDPTRPQALVVGRAVVAGSLDYANTSGSAGNGTDRRENVWLAMAIRLADHPIEDVERIWVNGEIAAYRGTPPAPSADDIAITPTNLLTYVLYDGTQTAADPHLHLVYGGAATNPWPETAIGRSTAYARTFAFYEKEAVNRVPSYKWGLKGAKLYDPRFDDTVGGSGPQRYDDPSTHQYTRNPVIIAYNIVRGIRVRRADGSLMHFYGLEESDVTTWPLDNVMAAANECDRLVQRADGVWIPQYTAGGEITLDTPPYDAIEALAAAAGGRIADLGGRFRIVLPSMLTTPRYVITDDDVLISREVTFDVLAEDDGRCNTVAARYLDWTTGELADAPLHEIAAYIEADGGRRLRTLDCQMVDELDQVQRLQKQAALESRRQRKFAVDFGPWGMAIEAGDVLAWTSAANGFDGKLFVAETAAEEDNFDAKVIIREVDPDDYDWHPASEYRPRTDAVFGTVPYVVRDVLDFAAAPYILRGDLGTQQPAVLATWSNPDDAEWASFEVRRADDHDSIVRDRVDVTGMGAAGVVILARDLQRMTSYQVRMRIGGSGIGDGDWTLWLDVITPDVGYVDLADLGAELAEEIDKIDETAAALAAEIQARAAEMVAAHTGLAREIATRTRETADAAMAAATALVVTARVEADDRASGYRQTVALRDEAAGMRATLIEQITAARDDATAEIAELSDAMASADEAIATRITAVEAAIEGETAARAAAVLSLDGRVTAAEGTITAQGEAILAANAAIGTKASADAVTALTTRVTSAEGTITAQGEAIISAQAAIGTKASASAVTALETRVTSAEGVNTAQASAITSISATLDTKVAATAYNAFVVSTNSTLGSHASWISGVEATSNSGTATGRMFWDVQSGPGGLGAVFRLVVATNGANWSGGGSEAGLYISAASGSVVIAAAKTVIMSPAGTVAAFFDASGKVGKAYIPSITADMITTGTLIASSAQIGNLVVATSNIADQAVVERYPSIVNSIAFHNVGWQTIATVGISAPSDYGALITVSMICAFTASGIIATQYALDIDGANDVTEQLSWTDPSARFNYTAIKIRGAGSMTVSVRFYAGSAGNYQRLVELNVMRIKK